ncbi:MAG: arylesterase, partial [Bryobacterales bacterium]|nr:arylesterase [Bryobacterales bacterium]
QGVSGDTTAVALSRVEAAIARQPAWVIVALGANDGLRGLPLDAMERNLRKVIEMFRQSGAQVVLAGMKLPRNYGPEYVRDFDAVYPRLAEDLNLFWIPFLLENVAMVPELNNDDGIHPNAAGNAIIARQVAAALEGFLAD